MMRFVPQRILLCFDAVKIELSVTHPRPDICDLIAGADYYGLGPGVYPKAQAPKPPFHPFCRCMAVPLAWAPGTPKRNPNAARDYLRRLSTDEARRVSGSLEKLNDFLNGAELDEVINRNVDPLYHLKRLGEFDKTAILNPMDHSDYQKAKSGGRHKGLYRQWKDKSTHDIEKSIESLVEQVKVHKDKIENPMNYIDRELSKQEFEGLVYRYWPKEIATFEQEINVLRGVLAERKT